MILKRLIWVLLLGVLWTSSLLWAVRARLEEGTAIRVRLKTDLSSERVEEGNRVDFEVAKPVVVQGLIVVAEGAVAWGAVQSVKKGKTIKFDLQGLRVPNHADIKLRSIPARSNNPGRDMIKLETKFGDDVGALRGSEFTAYVDETVEVEGVAAPPGMAPPPSPAPAAPSRPQEARTPPPAPAPAKPTLAPPAPKPKPPAQPPAPAPAPARVVAPPTAPVAPPVIPPPAPEDVSGGVERVTVECFSAPSGADILIDGDFVGNTPSILKVRAGSHRLEIRLADYKTVSQALDLTAGMGLRTIRVTLEKKEE